MVARRHAGGTIEWHARHKQSGKSVQMVHRRIGGALHLVPLTRLGAHAALARHQDTGIKHQEAVYRDIAKAFGKTMK